MDCYNTFEKQNDQYHHIDVEYDSDKSQVSECTICLDPLHRNVFYFDCKHKIHIDCLQSYLHFNDDINHSDIHIKCPMCREITIFTKKYKNSESNSHSLLWNACLTTLLFLCILTTISYNNLS